MTEDLLAFIEARIGEDELWALAASAPYHGGGPTVAGGMIWRWGVGGDWEAYEPDPLEQYLGENDSLSGDVSLVTCEEWPYSWSPAVTDPGRVLALDGAVRTADAAHIVRHDPARVVREVESKRQILRVVVAQIDDMDRKLEAEFGQGDFTTGGSDLLLKLLAAPYADHVAFRAEWALT